VSEAIAASASIGVERSGEVALLRMRAGENRFNPENLDLLEAALEEVESAEGGPVPLVLTGEGKFFCNGLDLEWMSSAPQGEPERVLDRVHGLLARLLAFPSFTVAAINGHAFAAGGMLALACDQRVMRADRGYFCLPEVDLGIPFSDGMSALIQAKLPVRTAQEAMLTGRRYGGGEAEGAGIVDEAVPEDQVLDRGVARASALAGRSPVAVAGIKSGLYQRALASLRGEGER
jgi:Delta3-Delta2-enoyl-CoA isomerase